ncbi:Uncharacterized protein dnm_014130 [Desulfonema magnum]|uniref:Uncharacterized protein n=1 Tax=Desulfonema magnum TaxID=45655 RepID=A0A975BHP3_9BACT|nr:Uncharacterized protein dnm_014130 [Desulfonema magnum]
MSQQEEESVVVPTLESDRNRVIQTPRFLNERLCRLQAR